jgi:hypothetical protein
MAALSVVSRVAVVVAALLLATTVVSGLNDNQTCAASTENPLANLVYTDPAVEGCVRARCIATLGTVPTNRTGGYCNGEPTSESAVPCATLFDAYNEYYACLVRALQGSTNPSLSTVITQANIFLNTPGFPYHLSSLGCFACNHFGNTVFPTLGPTCSNWTCASISSQSAAATWYGQPGKGYNYQLCGTGCIAVMLLTIPFALVSASMFIACGCCWPSPSLKTTYAEVQKEEEAERQRMRSDDDDDDEDANGGPMRGNNANVAHEPVVADTNLHHPEEETRPDEYVNLR